MQQQEAFSRLHTAVGDFLEGVGALQQLLPAADLPAGSEMRAYERQQLLKKLKALQQQLVATQDALRAASGAESADADRGSSSSSQASAAALLVLLPRLSQRLVACGEALAALCPVLLCCNNPGCIELRGASEQQLVSHRDSLCSRCRAAHYCSKACQVAHFPAHKEICKSIADSQAK